MKKQPQWNNLKKARQKDLFSICFWIVLCFRIVECLSAMQFWIYFGISTVFGRFLSTKQISGVGEVSSYRAKPKTYSVAFLSFEDLQRQSEGRTHHYAVLKQGEEHSSNGCELADQTLRTNARSRFC